MDIFIVRMQLCTWIFNKINIQSDPLCILALRNQPLTSSALLWKIAYTLLYRLVLISSYFHNARKLFFLKKCPIEWPCKVLTRLIFFKKSFSKYFDTNKSEEVNIQKDIWTPILIAALFTVASTGSDWSVLQ